MSRIALNASKIEYYSRKKIIINIVINTLSVAFATLLLEREKR